MHKPPQDNQTEQFFILIFATKAACACVYRSGRVYYAMAEYPLE